MIKFIVVGTQRTGSSAISEAIGTHPYIGCGWEWSQNIGPFRIPVASNEALFSSNYKYLDDSNRNHALSLQQKDLSCMGYRRLFRSTAKWLIKPELSPVYLFERLEWHLNWIVQNQIPIIHIVRTNNLGWLKSKAITKKTGSFFGEKYDENIQADINPAEALKRIKAKHWLDNRLAKLKSQTPYIRVIFEDFCSDDLSETKRIVRFLGEDPGLLPVLEKEMKLKPQSSRSDAQMLSNYSELENLLNQNDLLTYTPPKD